MIKHTRQQAKALGLNKCYGSICAKHPDLEGFRHVSGSCVQCGVERTRKYRAANPELTRQHRLKSQAYTKLKRKTDAEARAKKLEADRLYRLANKEATAQSKRAWYAANPGRATALSVKRKAAVKMRIPKWLTQDDHWILKEAYHLAALRTKMFGFAWEVDHVIPLQGDTVSGLHVPENIQVIPRTLNRAKWNKYEVSL
jgi:hypothetical protein